MKKFMETGDGKYINRDPEKVLPIIEDLSDKVASLIQKFEY